MVQIAPSAPTANNPELSADREARCRIKSRSKGGAALGTHAPRDRENHPASPKSESKHTAETLSGLLRSPVGDADPHNAAATAAAEFVKQNAGGPVQRSARIRRAVRRRLARA